MRVLDIFSGIGGFSLGLESVGMQTVAFCEADGYARRVLRRHWPDVWLYEDVRTLTAKRLKQDGITEIDLICGGFPCQDISCAGKGAGIEGSRSGLWSEYARLIREIRPRWVITENVPALRSRGADRVLGDLEAAGYTAWPLVVGALHAGAPHRRQRAWIVAHTAGDGRGNAVTYDREHATARQSDRTSKEAAGRSGQAGSQSRILADAEDLGSQVDGWEQGNGQQQGPDRQTVGQGLCSLSVRSGQSLSHSPRRRLPTNGRASGQGGHADEPGSDATHSPERTGHDVRRVRSQGDVARNGLAIQPWQAEPDVGRVAHGVPSRVDRLRCLGNAVVPQVVAMIGQAVLDADRCTLMQPDSLAPGPSPLAHIA